MILDIIKKIENLKSYDSKTIIETFSFAERKLLITEINPLLYPKYNNLIKEFFDKIIDGKIVIFTEEELDQIQIDFDDYYYNQNDILFFQYSDEKILKLITAEGFKRLNLQVFLKKDESRYKLIELYINDEIDEDYADRIIEVIEAAKSDEFKLKCIQLLSKLPRKKRIQDYDISRIVSTLSNDDAKIEALHLVSNMYKSDVISSMESDDTKVRYINLFSKNKGDIIYSLKDDELKESYFVKYYRLLSGEAKAKIIASFDNAELSKKYLSLINTNAAIEEFIIYSRNEDLMFEAAKKLTSDKYILNILDNFRNPKYQLEILKKVHNINLFFKDDEFYYSNLSFEALSYLLPQINQEKKELMVRSIPYPQNVLILTNFDNFNQALECLGHIEDYMFTEYNPKIDPAISYFAQNLNVKPERLHRLVVNTGPLILKHLQNKNIINCLNLSDEDFEKYMALISPENQRMDMNSVNDLLNAILNRRFKLEKPDDDQIFSKFQEAKENKDRQRIYELFNQLSTLIDINLRISNLEEFIDKYLERDKETTDKLHNITQEYIRIAKDNFTRENINQTREQMVDISVERGDYLKFILAVYSTEDLVKILQDLKSDIPESNLQDLLNNEELLASLIEYKKDPKKYGEPPKELKSSLKDFNVILNYLYKLDSPVISRFEDLKKSIKITEQAQRQRVDNVVDIVTELNVSELKDTIFNNEELYQELLNFISKYKVLGWTDQVQKVASENGINIYNGILAALISNYEAIMRNLNNKVSNGEIPRITISHIIDLAACYDGSSTIYKYIFGAENFVLIKNNPPDNKASMSAEERIRRALELLSSIKARDSITTPPIDKDYKISNGKELHVRLGHVNSLNNLTYGERTGACMRIGGVGESLFSFCLLNKHGFHIEINNPRTGEFVSRVSGFRNGNTVFLNQLRFSKSSLYKSEDLIELIKQVANDIIELSKQSKMPIDNVVISDDYVMRGSKEKTTNLGVSSIKKGLGSFYTDVDNKPIVLATSSQTSTFVPVSLGTRNLPEYEPLRERMRIYKDEEAVLKINEMVALDEYLNGKALEEIEPKLDFDINTCYIGEDWYISISNDGQITTYIMSSSRNREKAEQEMKKVLMIIKEKSEKQIAMNIGQEELTTSSSMHM